MKFRFPCIDLPICVALFAHTAWIVAQPSNSEIIRGPILSQTIQAQFPGTNTTMKGIDYFNNDVMATPNYHAFCLDLQTDAEGNFYFAKGAPWPPNVDSPHQGTLLKVSKDGSRMEVFATGLRGPNGLAISPKGEMTIRPEGSRRRPLVPGHLQHHPQVGAKVRVRLALTTASEASEGSLFLASHRMFRSLSGWAEVSEHAWEFRSCWGSRDDEVLTIRIFRAS